MYGYVYRYRMALSIISLCHPTTRREIDVAHCASLPTTPLSHPLAEHALLLGLLLILSHYVNLVGTSATFSSLSLHCTRSSYTRRSPETRPSLLICRHGRLIYRTIYNPALQQLPTLPVLDFELPRSLWYKLYCDPPRRGIGTCQPDPLLHRDHTKKARSSRSAFSSGNNPRDIR